MKKIGIIISMLFLLSSSGFAQETIVEGKSKKGKEQSEQIVVEGKKGIGVKVKVDEEARPMIIIDGKEYDNDILDMIDPDKIESITIVKGEKAIHEYDAENGVIIIEGKKKEKANFEIKNSKDDSTIIIRGRSKIDLSGTEDRPVVVIDGVEKDKDALDRLSPEDIHRITILKDEKAKRKYNSESGVILIETKKKQ